MWPGKEIAPARYFIAAGSPLISERATARLHASSMRGEFEKILNTTAEQGWALGSSPGDGTNHEKERTVEVASDGRINRR